MNTAILGTVIWGVDYRTAVSRISDWANKHESRSVFAANVHMVMEAYDHADFREIVNHADLVTPDGMPLVWVLRRKGMSGQQRVYGPTLMLEVLKIAEEKNIRVGFLGSTEEVLQELSKRMLKMFPHLQIGAGISPPFATLSPEDDQAITEKINQTDISILFVALGCPKQERWIAAHKGRINAVMVGVGAAFAFHAGTIRQAPAWMQKIGVEWLYRLSQEPARLWKRYLVNNPRFVILVIFELLREKFQKK